MQMGIAGNQPQVLGPKEEWQVDRDFVRNGGAQIQVLLSQGGFQAGEGLHAQLAARQRRLGAVGGDHVPVDAGEILGHASHAIEQAGKLHGLAVGVLDADNAADVLPGCRIDQAQTDLDAILRLRSQEHAETQYNCAD